MHHQEFDPPKALSDQIKCFWYNRRDFGDVPSSFAIIPDSYAEIIFHFGAGCSISYNGITHQLPSPFLMGLLDHPVEVTSQNILEIIGVRCFPWTVFDLLNLEPGKDSVRIFEHPISHLQSALSKFINDQQPGMAIALLSEYFLRSSPANPVDQTLSKAGAAMTETNGSMQVSEVAAAAHATVRTLERKFKQSAGRTVKDVSGLMRFEKVRNKLWNEPDVNLAGLAHEVGYTDQSHLSREFKRYSGTTPGAFARKARLGKKIVINDFVAFMQS